jgi:exodeoxyribonuclease VIII
VFKWATGDTLGLWRFGVVESDAPYCVNPVRLSDDVVAYGRKLYRADLRRYADCLNSGEWPGLPGGDHVLPMPGWYVNQMEEDV